MWLSARVTTLLAPTLGRPVLVLALVAALVQIAGVPPVAAVGDQREPPPSATFVMTIDEPCYAAYAGGSYPPNGQTNSSGCGGMSGSVGVGTDDLRASRSYHSGTGFVVANGFARWDTSALPDDAVVTRAYVTWDVVEVANVDGRSLSESAWVFRRLAGLVFPAAVVPGRGSPGASCHPRRSRRCAGC